MNMLEISKKGLYKPIGKARIGLDRLGQAWTGLDRLGKSRTD